jgi:hypothetical protein
MGVKPWLARLAMLTRPDERRPVEAIDLYAQALADADARLFCLSSLRAVAETSPFFPALAELRQRLAAWGREHLPRPLLADQVDAPHLTAVQRSWVAWFWRRRQEAGPVERLTSMLLAYGGQETLDFVAARDPLARKIALEQRLIRGGEDAIEGAGAVRVLEDGLPLRLRKLGCRTNDDDA